MDRRECKLTRVTLQTYTREDVQKHTSASDAWLIVEGGVYDV